MLCGCLARCSKSQRCGSSNFQWPFQALHFGLNIPHFGYHAKVKLPSANYFKTVITS
jgi:hypothetical protein